eukprot:70828_1
MASFHEEFTPSEETKYECTRSDMDVSKCIHLERLCSQMQRYHLTSNATEFASHIHLLLDDFLHLLSMHQNQFDIITHRFGVCDINQCNIIRRNYRNRNTKMNQTTHHLENACMQILDKIHCYYSHCYDIGNKLTSKDHAIINEQKCEQIDDVDRLLRNQTIIPMKRIQKRIRQSCQHINGIQQTSSKYNNQLIQPIINDQMYSFGIEFCYGYDTEYNTENAIKIKAKYASLKHELTHNEISHINIEQFNVEYSKAQIHFNSHYRRKHAMMGELKMHHLLALLIYCNYDFLQCEFSKTYRDNISEHNNFYYLGKYIKIAVHDFGENIGRKYKKLYHGVSKELLFPQIIGNDRKPINIFIPLSTSSSFEVAANFANDNSGLILQFGGSFTPYFDVSWLSDFGNESEKLFIQGRTANGHLKINNIVNCQTGTELQIILRSLALIDQFISAWHNCSDGYQQIVKDNGIVVTVLIERLIHHQLSYRLRSYKAFVSLDAYVQQAINIYFENQRKIVMHMDIIYEKRFEFFYKILFDLNKVKKGLNIDLHILSALFPHGSAIQLIGVNLCALSMENILCNLKAEVTGIVTELMLVCNENSDLLVEDAISAYAEMFKQIKFNMIPSETRHCLHLERDDCVATFRTEIQNMSDESVPKEKDNDSDAICDLGSIQNFIDNYIDEEHTIHDTDDEFMELNEL